MEEKIISHFNKKGLAGDKIVKNKICYLQNRDEIEEDAFQCKYCTDLCFMSMISCKICTKADEDEREEQLQQEKSATPDSNESKG
jgi:hypothetical protein